MWNITIDTRKKCNLFRQNLWNFEYVKYIIDRDMQINSFCLYVKYLYLIFLKQKYITYSSIANQQKILDTLSFD